MSSAALNSTRQRNDGTIRVDPLKTLKYHHDELGKIKTTVESLSNASNEVSELKQTIISMQVSSLNVSSNNEKVLTELAAELERVKGELSAFRKQFDASVTIINNLSTSIKDLKEDVPVKTLDNTD